MSLLYWTVFTVHTHHLPSSQSIMGLTVGLEADVVMGHMVLYQGQLWDCLSRIRVINTAWKLVIPELGRWSSILYSATLRVWGKLRYKRPYLKKKNKHERMDTAWQKSPRAGRDPIKQCSLTHQVLLQLWLSLAICMKTSLANYFYKYVSGCRWGGKGLSFGNLNTRNWYFSLLFFCFFFQCWGLNGA